MEWMAARGLMDNGFDYKSWSKKNPHKELSGVWSKRSEWTTEFTL